MAKTGFMADDPSGQDADTAGIFLLKEAAVRRRGDRHGRTS